MKISKYAEVILPFLTFLNKNNKGGIADVRIKITTDHELSEWLTQFISIYIGTAIIATWREQNHFEQSLRKRVGYWQYPRLFTVVEDGKVYLDDFTSRVTNVPKFGYY